MTVSRRVAQRHNVHSILLRSFAADVYDRSKPHVNIGTIGHVDHVSVISSPCVTSVCEASTHFHYLGQNDIDASHYQSAE